MALPPSPTSMFDLVLVQEKERARTIVLNRPKHLNVLSESMISRLLELLLKYEQDLDVKLIILKGNGKAFCAGGDIIAALHILRKGNWKAAGKYYVKQNTLNYVIATYRKPQVSIFDGIIMGAGAGISVHGTYRVASEKTVFAMPETAIGLFPDVGASYFLSRLPGFFGEYVGLTGARLDGTEMLACGLATHFVRSVKLVLLEQELIQASSSDGVDFARIIDNYAEQPALKANSAYHQLDIIDRCFSRATVEEILSSLEHENAKKHNDWISKSIQSLKSASPMSLKISLRSIREGRFQELGQCLVREFRATCHTARLDISQDFITGIQATLIDKDDKPKWDPSRLDLVTDSMVDRYFSRVDDDEWKDLELPERFSSNLPTSAILAKL